MKVYALTGESGSGKSYRAMWIAGKYNLKYADAILASKASHQAKPEIEVDEELKALLDGAYVKK